ncbi:MAG: hypothetical protein A2885_13460 [Sphingopyxis sp. RIFCSPHIGHO2_01_FULL_65_24]|nr:MAG: hypothetical protein A2885_13460 [Sphingopyxis sp. RIFCSPHIGHO2_01_FULL_65_24]
MLCGIHFGPGGECGVARIGGSGFANALRFVGNALSFGLVGEQIVSRVCPDRVDRHRRREPEQPGQDDETGQLGEAGCPRLDQLPRQQLGEAPD